MIAEIRPEAGFFNSLSCVAQGNVYYTLKAFTRQVFGADGELVCELRVGHKPKRFMFSDRTTIEITDGFRGLRFDGIPVREEWPLPTKRLFVSGSRRFIIRPEGDAVMFEFEGALPPADMAVAAFLVCRIVSPDISGA